MSYSRKDLLDLRSLSPMEIGSILDAADKFREVLRRPLPKVPALRGKTVGNLFFEPSTRTRFSFDLAAKRLSADVVNFASSTSSVRKGESLLDSARNIIALRVDALIIRHACSGAAQRLARAVPVPVINAGDGMHEHPTQGLLDLYSIRENKKRIKGLTVAILGDMAHSRVARSAIWGLTKMGARVRVCCPPPLMPIGIANMGVETTFDVDSCVKSADVIMVLRIQRERQDNGSMPALQEYRQFYALTWDRLTLAKPDAILMHPGPVNRGVELPPKLADSARSIILHQVTNGIAVRMAVLYILLARRT